MYFKIQ